jgi:hypothetical protein
MIICNRGAGLSGGAFLSLQYHEGGCMAGRDIPFPLFMKRKAVSTPMCRISITATRITDLFRVKIPARELSRPCRVFTRQQWKERFSFIQHRHVCNAHNKEGDLRILRCMRLRMS